MNLQALDQVMVTIKLDAFNSNKFLHNLLQP
jgi:hypothetical protein